MRQIFRPVTNLIARISILAGLLLFTAVVVVVLIWLPRSSVATGVGKPVPQPVNYSHALHAGALGIECRYCHMSVQKSSFADIPPTETCMTCHSQVATDRASLALVRESFQTGKSIAWNKVYTLPAFVYFSHDIHVAKGVGCETCHGRVDQMNTVSRANSLLMEWCLACHRNPAPNLRPQANIFDMGYQPSGDKQAQGAQLMKEYQIEPISQLTNCSTCHR